MGSVGNSSFEHGIRAEDFSPSDTIETDVCVIGGGSSGAYTAVRVKDSGHSVVLVEAKSRLGGHAENYVETNSNQTLDVGVAVFGHSKEVDDFLGRFQIPLKIIPITIAPPDYVDFKTGATVGFDAPGPEAIGAAMQKYAVEVAKYPKVQEGFELPDPVPEDLLLPFGEFVKKHGLEDLVQAIFSYCHGYLPLLELSTIYIFKYFNAQLIDTLNKGFRMTEENNVGTLYSRAADYLGSSVLLQSRVTHMDRGEADGHGPAKIVVDTPSGPKLIQAKKIISTIPHHVENLHGYDLSDTERRLFSQFKYSAYYAGIIANTGLTQWNPIHAYGDSLGYGLPELPGMYAINPSKIPGVYQFYYGSPAVLPEDTVRDNVVTAIKRMQSSRGIEQSAATEPQILKLANHTPFNLIVPPEAIRSGFYRELTGLQGQRNTFYSGASFHAQDSTVLWKYTEELLPRVLAGLK